MGNLLLNVDCKIVSSLYNIHFFQLEKLKRNHQFDEGGGGYQLSPVPVLDLPQMRDPSGPSPILPLSKEDGLVGTK